MNKLIIIGAPRSGTNILRDVLTSFKKVGTWPCDEINLIWRYNNSRYPNDEFSVDMAKKNNSEYIRKQFEKLGANYSLETVVEKTCANSLRVGFVNKILPDAKYIFIYRNGFDAVASAKKRWTSSFDLKYTMKKLRFVPYQDFPYYGYNFIKNRITRAFSDEKRLKTWGPVIEEFDSIDSMSLNEICAYQWKKCIKNSLRDFSKIDETRFFKVKYEEFVTNPFETVEKICNYSGINPEIKVIERAIKNVSAKSIGKYKKELSASEIDLVGGIISEEMKALGYEFG
jgi:6-pyruvoyl-tetrahydropterin synthase